MQEKKAVFIDRDGVICVDKDLTDRKEEIELIPRAAEAIKLGLISHQKTSRVVTLAGLKNITAKIPRKIVNSIRR